jgi:hypothetical protein
MLEFLRWAEQCPSLMNKRIAEKIAGETLLMNTLSSPHP